MAGQQRGKGERDSSPTATTGEQKPVETKAAKTEIYHVVGPGSLMRKGELLPPGELIELTEKEAKELGGLVALGEAPPPPVPVAKRKAGKYSVKGPGSVLRERTLLGPGTMLELNENDARSLGDAVEPV